MATMNGPKASFVRGRGRGRGVTGRQPYPGGDSWPGETTEQGSGFNNDERTSVCPKSSSPVKQQGNSLPKTAIQPVRHVEERFADAASRHQEALQRHFVQSEEVLSSSEEEDDVQNDSDILGNMLETLKGSLGYDPGDIGSTGEYITSSMKSKASVCLICLETIKRMDPIWCCVGCYTMFHIGCIQKWVKDGVYQNIGLVDDLPSKDLPWNCPKCRHCYSQLQCPTRYFCFCGKEEDPQFDPWRVPHSCGEICSKKLRPECGHTCLLLCHPGPCPPCPQTVRTTCYCGKQPPQIRRCGVKEWSCEQACASPLNCGHHTCQTRCHPGNCPPCPFKSVQPCECGAERTERLCADSSWQCQKVCNRPLACGHHVCERVCHSGACGACPRAGNRSCPCGKTVTDTPCTEDVPTCPETCEKVLECGLHKCTSRCHTGPCGTCREMTLKTCRCGNRKKELQCYKSYTCDTKCANYKDCGKHQCKRKCCSGDCPPCELQCNKQLGCGNHKCTSRCHRGQCYPCTETFTLACACGATKMTVACGREKVLKPPRCNLRCKTPPECHHPQRDPHRCHTGRCPPCLQACNKTLKPCGHSCPVRCHSAILTIIREKVQRATPCEAAPEVRQELVDHPCPPCRQPMSVTCLGKHETVSMPCSEVRVHSCGRLCGRQLSCGNHTCPLACHEVKGAANPQAAGTTCLVCEEPCTQPRPEGCAHPCLRTCHPGDCEPCRQLIRMRCHCQVMLKHIDCDAWCHADDRERDRLKSCGCRCPKMLTCGHQCHVMCHPGSCPDPSRCVEKVRVKCPCKRRKTDFLCNQVFLGDADVECDDICQQQKEAKKKEKEEAERLRKEEEARKQRQELEEYERKVGLRSKKKKKKPKNKEESPRTCAKYAKFVIAPVLVVIMAVFVYYLIEVSKH